MEFRRWLDTVKPPPGLRDYGSIPAHEDLQPGRAWQRMLYDAGWAGVSWPAEYGGRGASLLEQGLFLEELAKVGLPPQVSLVGLELAGPIVIAAGTPEQKDRHLRPILRGDELWCQLFSEPDAGSDLSSLRTSAVPDGVGWRIRGQKVWTSGAHYADFGLLLARSDEHAPRHRGLSCFIVPMDRRGIEIRPIRQMDEISKFNEVFLDDVKVHQEDLLGELHSGWSLALSVLGRERLMLGANTVKLDAVIHELWDDVAKRNLSADALFCDRWISLWVQARLLRLTWLRILTALDSDSTPGEMARVSCLKVMGSELQRDVAALAAHVLGREIALSDDADAWRARLLAAPGATIMGGTSEIQRNILAERVLSLPREPS